LNWGKNELNNKMQEGYRLSMLGNSKATSNVWLVLWGNIKETMNKYKFDFIDDLDKAFHLTQSRII
jgi:hypothetical protein